jgi:hypothetical protein
MSEKNMRDYTQIYIDGTSVVSAGGETIDVINQQRNSPRGRSRVTANAAAFLALDHASYVNGADVHSAHTEDDHEDVRNSRSRNTHAKWSGASTAELPYYELMGFPITPEGGRLRSTVAEAQRLAASGSPR